VLNQRGKFGAKILSHYTDIVILVLKYFLLTHPVQTLARVVVISQMAPLYFFEVNVNKLRFMLRE